MSQYPAPEPKFRIGQKVRPDDAYVAQYPDWRDTEFWVTAIRVPVVFLHSWGGRRDAPIPSSYGIVYDYTLSETWPPCQNGDLTNDWHEDMLVAIDG